MSKKFLKIVNVRGRKAAPRRKITKHHLKKIKKSDVSINALYFLKLPFIKFFVILNYMKIVIVMPAYNAAHTLEKTYNDIPKNIASETILVDDQSHDKTVEIANKLGIKTFLHNKNLGYGGNQKTCYREALKLKADIVVMLHPDYQYDPKLIPFLIEPIKQDVFDIMLGSRVRTRKDVLEGGMPLYKYLGNRLLTFLENLVLGLNLSEYHTGFRAYSKKVLKKLPLEKFSNDFVFDQQILISAHSFKFRIGEIFVPTKYFPEASSINLQLSIRYGILTLYQLVKYTIGKY